MSATVTAPQTTQSAKRSAALFSVLAAAVLAALKLATGVLTGSLGVLSEGAHSSIDLIAAILTLVSVRVADRPADEEHNYGHGKIESLSAFVEIFLMLVSCIWIVTEAVRRLLHGTHLSLPLSIWPFAVLVFSILVDISRSRTLSRIARESGSPALEADAIHFFTDIWSSLAVLLGLASTLAGEQLHIPVLELADPIAGIVVSAIILRVTVGMARKTINALLDASPTTEAGQRSRDQILGELTTIPGVVHVERLRVRQSGANVFADLALEMPRTLTFQRSEQITAEATAAVQRHLPGADVVVHSIPTATRAESVHDRVRAVAARANLSIHDVSLRQVGAKLHLEQHLELDETMPLRRAHTLVTDLESDIRREIPEVSAILTHIESEPATIARHASLEQDRQLEVRLRPVARTFPAILDIHHVRLTPRAGRPPSAASTVAKSPDRIEVTCHCTLPDDLPMARVHGVITELESAFRLDSPEVSRLLIHPEPATDNRR